MKLGIDEGITSKNINRIYELFNNEYPNKENDVEVFNAVITTVDGIINDNTYRQSFLSSKVHLYSLFTLIFGMLVSGKPLNDEQIYKYRNFIDNYDNVQVLEKYFENKIALIDEYKSKSKEGTNQKSNRLRRFEILSELVK